MIFSHRFYIAKKLSFFLVGQDYNIFHLLHCVFTREPKNISAIVRAKNEEKFLEASVRSIIDHVEEIVIIDNNSTDRTPEIIANLIKEYPQKVRAYQYKHDVKHIGEEILEEYAHNPHSPNLESNHCNWCLQKTTCPYVIRWDADMIATEAFAEVLSFFKKAPFQSLNFTGKNIWSDYMHYCAQHPASEPRVFRKKYARYIQHANQHVIGAILKTPILLFRFFSLKTCYLHLKMCKVNPLSNRFGTIVRSLQYQKGEEISEEARDILSLYL